MVGSRTWLILSSCALAVSCGGDPPEAVSPDSAAGAPGSTASTHTEMPAARSSTGMDESDAHARSYAVRDLPDPAMAGSDKTRSFDEGSQIAAEDFPEETGVQEEPDVFTVDAENGRVFIPGRGWITAEDFWEMYYNSPQELPGDIDHEALNAIRPKSG